MKDDQKTLEVAALLTIAGQDADGKLVGIEKQFAKMEKPFLKQLAKNDKARGVKSRYTEILVVGYGQTREFTMKELLSKLGFNVPSV